MNWFRVNMNGGELHEEPPGYSGGNTPAPLSEYLRKLERALKRGGSVDA